MTTNETAEEKEICLSKRRSGDYKNWFEEMKSTRRECTLYSGEKAATKYRRARLRVQSACKGQCFIDKASRKEYNQTRDENRLNDWKLDGE